MPTTDDQSQIRPTDIGTARAFTAKAFESIAQLQAAPVAPVAPVAPAVTKPVDFAARFTTAPGELSSVNSPAPAAPAAPQHVPDPEPAVPLGADGKPDKAAHAFAKLRHENTQLSRQMAEQKAKLDEETATRTQLAKERADIQADRDRVAQDRDALQERLGKVSLAESPEFQRKYSTREAELQGKLSSALVKFAGVDQAQALVKAREMLTAEPSALQELVKDLHPHLQGAVVMASAEYATINEQKTQELNDWRKNSAALNVESARTDVIRSVEQRRKWAETALDAARTLGNPLYNAADPADVQTATAVSEAFRGFAQTATEEQLLRAAAEGFSAPVLYETISQQSQMIQDLTNRLAAFDRARSVPMFPANIQPPAPVPPPAAKQANVIPVTASTDPTVLARESAEKSLRDFMNQGR